MRGMSSNPLLVVSCKKNTSVKDTDKNSKKKCIESAIPYSCTKCKMSTYCLKSYVWHIVQVHLKNDQKTSTNIYPHFKKDSSIKPSSFRYPRYNVETKIKNINFEGGSQNEGNLEKSNSDEVKKIPPIKLKKFSKPSNLTKSSKAISLVHNKAVVVRSKAGEVSTLNSLQHPQKSIVRLVVCKATVKTNPPNEVILPDILMSKPRKTDLYPIISNLSMQSCFLQNNCKSMPIVNKNCLMPENSNARNNVRSISSVIENTVAGSSKQVLSTNQFDLLKDVRDFSESLSLEVRHPTNLKPSYDCESSGTEQRMNLNERNVLNSLREMEKMTTTLDELTQNCDSTEQDICDETKFSINEVERNSTEQSDPGLDLAIVSVQSFSENELRLKKDNRVRKRKRKAVCPLTTGSSKIKTLLESGLVTMPLSKENNFDLDTIPLHVKAELKESFLAFPYPQFQKLRRLSSSTGLPPHIIKLWFAQKRLHCGISWDPDEIQDAFSFLQDPDSDSEL